jgi:hypothetical protein
MAFTSDDLGRINRAIASGAFQVVFSDRTVMYQSMDGLLKARKEILADLARQSGRKRQTLGVARKGF